MDNLFYSYSEEYNKVSNFFYIIDFVSMQMNPQDQEENIKNGNSLCFDPEFVESICSMQKIRIIKTVRFVGIYL